MIAVWYSSAGGAKRETDTQGIGRARFPFACSEPVGTLDARKRAVCEPGQTKHGDTYDGRPRQREGFQKLGRPVYYSCKQTYLSDTTSLGVRLEHTPARPRLGDELRGFSVCSEHAIRTLLRTLDHALFVCARLVFEGRGCNELKLWYFCRRCPAMVSPIPRLLTGARHDQAIRNERGESVGEASDGCEDRL